MREEHSSAAWPPAERAALAAVATAATLVGGAGLLEYDFGMLPCALCLTQRLCALLAGLAALAGLAHGPRRRGYAVATLALAAIGAYFSLRHLYLLWLPPGEVAKCGVDFDYLLAAFPLADVLQAMLAGTGECAEQSAALPALALAGFLALAALAVLWWRAARSAAAGGRPR